VVMENVVECAHCVSIEMVEMPIRGVELAS